MPHPPPLSADFPSLFLEVDHRDSGPGFAFYEFKVYGTIFQQL